MFGVLQVFLFIVFSAAAVLPFFSSRNRVQGKVVVKESWRK